MADLSHQATTKTKLPQLSREQLVDIPLNCVVVNRIGGQWCWWRISSALKICSYTVAYPELVSRGVSKSCKFKWLVQVGACKDVNLLIKKKSWPGGGVSGQPENPPGYATDIITQSRICRCRDIYIYIYKPKSLKNALSHVRCMDQLELCCCRQTRMCFALGFFFWKMLHSRIRG